MSPKLRAISLPRSTNRTFSATVQPSSTPDRGEEEEVPVCSLEEGDPLQVVDTHGLFKGLQRGGRRQGATDGGIDPALGESLNEGCLRLLSLGRP